MLRTALLAVCCAVLGACTVVDFGVARGQCPPNWELGGPAGYAAMGWPANNDLLSADLLGGPNGGSLISVDLWRLVHVELGLLGLGLGIGPFQIGGGFGFYHPGAPAMLPGMNPFVCEAGPATP